MKKLLLSSFAITALTLSGCAAVESNRTIETKAVQADYSVPYEQRKKVVVSNFNNASDYQRGVFSSDKDRLGSQAQDILSSQLQMTNFFRVVNRRAAGTGVGGTNAFVPSPAQGDVYRPRTRALPQRCSALGTLDPTHGLEGTDA